MIVNELRRLLNSVFLIDPASTMFYNSSLGGAIPHSPYKAGGIHTFREGGIHHSAGGGGTSLSRRGGYSPMQEGGLRNFAGGGGKPLSRSYAYSLY